MKLSFKSASALCFLVLTVYVMRGGNLSLSQPLAKGLFRTLYSYARPASPTCDSVSITSAYSAGDIERSQSLQTSLSKTRNGNPFQTMLTSGGFNTDAFVTYAKTLIPALAVWAIFFVLSLILCCCAVCNWCCIHGICKNCACCRCCKAPRTNRRKKMYTIATMVMMLGIFSAGIAGASFAPQISVGMLKSYCSILNMIEDLNYGNQNSKWLGMGGMIESLNNIISQFTNTINSLNSVSTSTTNMDNSYTTASNSVTTYYNADKNVVINRADPAVGGTYQPDYITNLGPKTSSGTYTYAIQAEMDAKRTNIKNAIGPINDAVNTLKSQSNSIKSGLSAGVSVAKNIQNSLGNLVDTLNNSGSTINSAITAVGKVITAIFIVYIVVALLPIISVLLIHFRKMKFFSKVLHISWFILGLLCVLGFLICTIFHPISIVFTEVCEVLTQSVNDGNFFSQTLGQGLASVSSQARDITYTCLFGNGAALDSLGITNQIGYFSTIYTQLDSVNSVAPLASSRPVPSVTINYQLWYATAAKSGFFPDSQKTVDDVSTLNSLTNKGSNSCTPDQDTWILSSVNCTSSQGTNFTTSSASNFNIPSATCIGLDNWNAASGSSTSRYSASSDYPTSCPTKNGGTEYSYVTSFVTNLARNYKSDSSNTQSTNTVFAKVNTDLTSLHNDEAQFGGYVYDTIQPFATLKSQLMGIQDSLVGTANGLIPNTNCNFIGTDLRVLTNNLCTGFISAIFQATTVLIVCSMFAFVGGIATFCLAKRILIEDDQKIQPNPNYPSQGQEHFPPQQTPGSY